MNRSDQVMARADLNYSACSKGIGAIRLAIPSKARNTTIKSPGAVTARLTVELAEYCL